MKKKVLLIALAAILLVGASIGGTLAWLTATASVINTFTVGKVNIDLYEHTLAEDGKTLKTGETNITRTGNAYHLVPGETYGKDPTVIVNDGSEECYVFVKVANPFGDKLVPNIVSTNWIEVTVPNPIAGEKVYKYTNTATAGQNLQVFTEVTASSSIVAETFGNIVVTAYAIQKEGLTAGLTDAGIFGLASA